MKNFINSKNLLISVIRIGKSLLTTQYALMLEYRAEIVLWSLSGVLPLLMLGLWSQSDVSNSLNIDKVTLSHYFISAFIVRQFTAVWVIISFEEDIIEGRLSPYLLQPIPPFWRYYFSHLAEQLTRLPFVIIILALLFLILPIHFWIPTPSNLILGSLVIFLAFTLRFLLHWAFAMICFWSEKASSIERILLIPYLFLSGLVAPIETFPALGRTIAYLTPYPYILSFPARILSGQPNDIFKSLLIILFWSLLFFLIGRFAWRKGVSQYTAMGA